MNIKIIPLSLICFALCITPLKAETWSCSYMWNGESRNWVIKREGNIFVKPTSGAIEKIVQETDEFIHLYNNILGFRTYYATSLDKIGKKFSMVGLEPGRDTRIISGNCVIY
tara:strand:+ start:145 stop:480 length:336 start_codon:yes stop_codon:yes gene_type:complete